MKRLKWLVIIIAMYSLYSCVSHSTLMQGKSWLPSLGGMEVTAEQLLKEYSEDDDAADKRYEGKKILLTGEIDEIRQTTEDRPELMFSSAHHFRFNSIFATMTRDQAAAVAKLKRGDRVELACVGDGEILNSPLLVECRLR